MTTVVPSALNTLNELGHQAEYLQTWVLLSSLPLIHHMPLGKSFSLCVPHFPFCNMGLMTDIFPSV